MRCVLTVWICSLLACVSAPVVARAADFSDLYKNIKPSVVYIVSATGAGAMSGTGFVYDSNSTNTTVATAYHVVDGAQKIDVVFDGDAAKRHPARLKEFDRKRDIAFLEVAVGNRKPLKLAQRAEISEAESIAIVGYPRVAKYFTRIGDDDLRPSVHMGIISALRMGGEVLQFDAEADYGDSGGPILDAKTGAVVGIVRGQVRDPSILGQLGIGLPGAEIGLSAPMVYAVRNGIAPPEYAAKTAAPGVPKTGAVQSLGSESAAYRVGFIERKFPTPGNQEFNDQLVARIRTHFTGDNSVYAIPLPFDFLNLDTPKMIGSCQDSRVNAVMTPLVLWTYDVRTAKIDVAFSLSDCAGIPHFTWSKLKSEQRSSVPIGKQLTDMANDLIDQLFTEVDKYRSDNAEQWNSLMKTGEPYATGTANHLEIGIIFKDGQFRVRRVRPGALGDRAGLREGDIISEYDGQIPDAKSTSPAAFAIQLDTASKIVVKRPEGPSTITLRGAP